MVRIFFIYADNCEHCQEALFVIKCAISKCEKIPCEILKYQYDSRAAIAIAVNKGINDLPGFVIGNDVYVGTNYSEERIIKSIKNAGKNE